jgi:hypothetical protein
MTPKEKAEELVLRYSKINARYKNSIRCALIAVDEILKQFTWKPSIGMAFGMKLNKK